MYKGGGYTPAMKNKFKTKFRCFDLLALHILQNILPIT